MLVAQQSFDGPIITVEREETIGHQHQSSLDQDASEIEKNVVISEEANNNLKTNEGSRSSKTEIHTISVLFSVIMCLFLFQNVG